MENDGGSLCMENDGGSLYVFHIAGAVVPLPRSTTAAKRRADSAAAVLAAREAEAAARVEEQAKRDARAQEVNKRMKKQLRESGGNPRRLDKRQEDARTDFKARVPRPPPCSLFAQNHNAVYLPALLMAREHTPNGRGSESTRSVLVPLTLTLHLPRGMSSLLLY